jgi:uncharacterized Zn-binding protein involved in type VI secretion
VNTVRRLSTVTAVLTLVLFTSATPQTFGGRATAVVIQLPTTGTTIRLADSGSLLESGGGIGRALLAANIPGSQTGGLVSLAAGTLSSTVVGSGRTDALASLADITLTIAENGIRVGFLMARGTAKCGSTPDVEGSAQLADLVVNGQPIAISGAPNQTIPLPNGKLVINEHLMDVGGGRAGITVAALHVTTRDALTGRELADVVLGSARAEVTCPPSSALSPQSAYADTAAGFTSGGGWLPPLDASFGKATFGFFGAADTGAGPKGHLVYIDHGGIDFRLESIEVTTFTAGCQSTMTGVAETNRGRVDFTVTQTDNGEPGRGDTFAIRAGTYFRAPDLLGGGNIQVDGTFAGGRVLAHDRVCR